MVHKSCHSKVEGGLKYTRTHFQGHAYYLISNLKFLVEEESLQTSEVKDSTRKMCLYASLKMLPKGEVEAIPQIKL